MRAFSYQRIEDTDAALRAMRSSGGPQAVNPPVQYLAGGTLLLDLLKLQVLSPDTVIDINALRREYGRIVVTEAGLHLGALVHMAQVQTGLGHHNTAVFPAQRVDIYHRVGGQDLEFEQVQQQRST